MARLEKIPVMQLTNEGMSATKNRTIKVNKQINAMNIRSNISKPDLIATICKFRNFCWIIDMNVSAIRQVWIVSFAAYEPKEPVMEWCTVFHPMVSLSSLLPA